MGKIPNLTNIFQMGWFNHQLEYDSPEKMGTKRKIPEIPESSSPPSHFCFEVTMCMSSRSWSLPYLFDSTQRWDLAGNGKGEKNLFQCLEDGLFCVKNGQILDTRPLNGQHVSIEIAPDDDESCIGSVGGGTCEIPWCLLFGRPYRPETNNSDIWLNLKHGIRARTCICEGWTAEFEPANGCHGYPPWDY